LHARTRTFLVHDDWKRNYDRSKGMYIFNVCSVLSNFKISNSAMSNLCEILLF